MTLRTLLFLVLGLLAIDAAIEMALVSSTVAYLHSGVPSHRLTVLTPPSFHTYHFIDAATYTIPGKPTHLIANPGHLSNAAAGTALLLVAVLGLLVHTLHTPLFHDRLLRLWRLLVLPALLLTVSALAFVFAEDHSHKHNRFDLSVAALDGPTYDAYEWTPQAWFATLLAQPLADDGTRASLARFLRIVHGWMYNLIPMFVLQLVVFLAVVYERWDFHHRGGHLEEYAHK